MGRKDLTTPGSLSGSWNLLYIGPILLFIAATAYGILEVHSSTDTWIGLAAGHQIYTSDRFPTTDTFSYTCQGEIWYNQNWLTHLFQYWLYKNIAPDAVIYGTWAMSASIFVLILLAAYWRSGTWLGALLAAAVVGLGCRDFLSARPATTGFFCIAALWALVCAIEGQRHKHRWWPIALLLPLLLVWGNAHGSFVFGYGVLGLYLGHWFVVRTIGAKHSWSFSLLAPLIVILIGGVMYSIVSPETRTHREDILEIAGRPLNKERLAALFAVLAAYVGYWVCIRRFRPRLSVSDRQVVGIAVVVAAALVLTAILSPFGLHNFTHGEKVASSEVFRGVSEWRPPYVSGRYFPPVWRFWVILGVSLGMLAAGGILWAFTPSPAQDSRSDRDRLHTSLFDVALVIIGLSMTIWARRFAPIYFIFGAPVFLTWIVFLLRRLGASVQRYLRVGVMAGAGLFAIAVAAEAGNKAYKEIYRPLERHPDFGLLESVTSYGATPHGAIMFLKNNNLDVNLLVEWTQGGPVMFYAPNAKVFMDGRAQQVYSEEHYLKYQQLMGIPDVPGQYLMKTLDAYDTNAVLLRRSQRVQNLWKALERSPQWVPVYLSLRSGLFLREGSRGLEQLGELLRSGKEWRPDTGAALAAEGFVWQAIEPPDPGQAIRCWKTAVRLDPLTGTICFRPITEALISLGREDDAREYVEKYYRLLNQPVAGMADTSRRGLLDSLTECWHMIQASKARREASQAGE